MSRQPYFHRAHLRLTFVLAFGATAFAAPSFAQSQTDSSQSVAEAARKARERKKTASKENQVITEDTLKLRPASSDASGTPPAGTVVTSQTTDSSSAAKLDENSKTPAAAATADKSAAAKPDAKSEKSAEKEKQTHIAEAEKTKQLLMDSEASLDVLKRKLSLDSDSFFSNPDHSRDSDGKAKLDELQSMIGDKQLSVDELKAKLNELLEKAGISQEDLAKLMAPQP
jgi:uncharacterized coiled-coil protein SlyX